MGWAACFCNELPLGEESVSRISLEVLEPCMEDSTSCTEFLVQFYYSSLDRFGMHHFVFLISSCACNIY